MNRDGITHLEGMRVAQSRIAQGDVRWFVQTANGWVVRGPFDKRDDAHDALGEIRRLAWEEHEEEQLLEGAG